VNPSQGLNNTSPTQLYNTTGGRLYTHQEQGLPDTQETEEEQEKTTSM